ncbi:hypothetical protein BRAS3843_1730066 [Bradyrhizobium sp. STM 3843]|nr:hypothetical protein BRAS3843_1730066 [Bradyrhizobium sp. STM 3843]
MPRLAREPKVLDRKRAQELLLMCDAKSRRTNAAAAIRLRLSEQAISSRMSLASFLDSRRQFCSDCC